jgi:cleavage stimulation factor subunit 3
MPSAPPPPPFPREISFLLNIIPHARHYDVPYIFNPQKLVAVFQAINLPTSVPAQQQAPPPVAQPTPMGQPMNHWGQPPPGYYGR